MDSCFHLWLEEPISTREAWLDGSEWHQQQAKHQSDVYRSIVYVFLPGDLCWLMWVCNFMWVSETDNAPHRTWGSGEMAVGKQPLARNAKLFFDFPFTSSVTHRGCGSQCVVWLLSENSIVYQCTRFYIFVCVVWMRIMLGWMLFLGVWLLVCTGCHLSLWSVIENS